MSATASLLNTELPNPVDVTQQEFLIDFTVAFAGSFAANGDTLDLTVLNAASSLVPNKVELWEATPASGKPASGFTFIYLPGTTQANGIIEIFSGSTQETASAATYASLNLPAAFVLRGRAWFTKFI